MVDRTSTMKRAQRATASSPYKRPSTSNSAPETRQSIFTTISNLFTSLWRGTTAADEEDNWVLPVSNAAAEALVERGNNFQAAQNAQLELPAANIFQGPPPSVPSQPPVMPPPPAPVVAPPPPSKFHFGRQERAGVSEPVANGTTRRNSSHFDEEAEEERPPFRFSSTIARNATLAATSSTSSVTSGSKPPPRMLSKNPNGMPVWRGAASAKPKNQRNRFVSPGFGPSRSAPAIKISPQKPATDAKRRKIDHEPESSQAGPSHSSGSAGQLNGSTSAPALNGAASSSSIPFPNGARSPSPASQQSAAQKLNGAVHGPPSTPRLRTTGLKPTAPAKPSPLRQAWGQNDSPSPPATKPRPTRAANIVSEIIRETAPPKKPAFINPYEEASPVPIPTRAHKKPLPPRRRAAATVQAESAKTATEVTEQKPEPAKERKPEAELSPQKIIEATLPKGAKRSRPPPDLEKRKEQQLLVPESGLRRSSRLKSPEPSAPTAGPSTMSIIVEEVDEDMPSPTKKSKSNGVPSMLKPAAEIKEQPTIQVEETDDAEMSEPSSSSKPVFNSHVVAPEPTPKGKEIKEKERAPSFVYGGPPNTTKPAIGLKSSAPKAPSKLRYSFNPEKEEKPQEENESSNSMNGSAFNIPISKPAFLSAQPVATPSVEISEPIFPVVSTSSSAAVAPAPAQTTSSAPKTAEIKATVLALPVHSLPQYTFEFSLALSAPGASVEKGKAAARTASVSSLPTFDFTKPATPPAPPAGGFNWAAAGLAPPSLKSGQWKCDCTTTNEAHHAKCICCESPRPSTSASGSSGPVPAPAVPVVGFDFAAAGMKAPVRDEGSWVCDCTTVNKKTDAKCICCEGPRPSSGVTPPPAPAAAPVVAFDFAAAGLKKPELTEQWQCNVCMLMNAKKNTKCNVCDAPAP